MGFGEGGDVRAWVCGCVLGVVCVLVGGCVCWGARVGVGVCVWAAKVGDLRFVQLF